MPAFRRRRSLKRGWESNPKPPTHEQYAGYKGYDVHHVFKDSGITGSRADRDGILDMLKYLKKNKATRHVVIVDDISRLARDIRVHLDLRDAIDSCGAVLESPAMTFGVDADGRYLATLTFGSRTCKPLAQCITANRRSAQLKERRTNQETPASPYD